MKHCHLWQLLPFDTIMPSETSQKEKVKNQMILFILGIWNWEKQMSKQDTQTITYLLSYVDSERPKAQTGFCSSPEHIWSFLARELTLHIPLPSVMDLPQLLTFYWALDHLSCFIHLIFLCLGISCLCLPVFWFP